jgi:hypothetical protein
MYPLALKKWLKNLLVLIISIQSSMNKNMSLHRAKVPGKLNLTKSSTDAYLE